MDLSSATFLEHGQMLYVACIVLFQFKFSSRNNIKHFGYFTKFSFQKVGISFMRNNCIEFLNELLQKNVDLPIPKFKLLM